MGMFSFKIEDIKDITLAEDGNMTMYLDLPDIGDDVKVIIQLNDMSEEYKDYLIKTKCLFEGIKFGD